MTLRRVTIRDVARLAGVSHQTVSRVMNQEEHVNTETRRRVLEVIEHLGFVPSHAARSLVTKRTHMVGLVIGDIGNPYFSDIARGVEDVLTTTGWSLVLANTDYDPTKEVTVVNHLIAKSVDGLIICDTVTPVDDLVTPALSAGIPTVLLNRTSSLSSPYLGVVRTDRKRAAFEATKYLIELGHTRIGFLLAERPTQLPRARLQGYLDALSAAGIPHDETLVVRENLGIPGGREAAFRLLDLQDPPSAVLCYNDLMALGLMTACAQRLVRVPEDLSVIGCDDISFASVVTPPLTTIRLPRLGEHAGEMLLKLIKEEPTEVDVMLPSVLVHRESCRPYNSAERIDRSCESAEVLPN